MDLYVFASHPTKAIREEAGKLLGGGEEGNRIRTRVDFAFGSSHAMYAIEAPTLAAASEHHSALATSGATTTYTLMSCTSPDCVPLLPSVALQIWPSWLPPFEILAFTLVWLQGPVAEWPTFDSPGLASAVEPGGRRMLIEFGSSDLDQINADLCRLGDLAVVARLESCYSIGSVSAD